MFVTFEGVEGSGKSTLAHRLHQACTEAGVPALLTSEPGGTLLGGRVRDLLLHASEPSPLAELLLFAADRAEHVTTVIRPALEQGMLVICDRFSDSTFAYQADRVPEDTLRALDLVATGGLRPDLTVLMDVPLQVSLARARARGRSDRIESRPESFHAQVDARYRSLAAREPERFLLAGPDMAPDELLDAILFRRSGRPV